MADWFCSPDGDAGGSGVDWSNRVDAITTMLALAYNPGDTMYAGPGVYREAVTLNGNGITVVSAGTVTVTNESTAVVGAGTGWNVAAPPLPVVAGDQLFIGNFVSEADGVANGTATFTTGGTTPFDSDMVGYMIEIIGAGAYLIAGYTNTSTVTLLSPNGTAWPAAIGNPYTFYVVSGEGPYKVASVTDATNLVLEKPWSGPTIAGLAYEIYRPVYLVADVSGENTDGVGGIVRVTGADADTGDPGVIVRADGFVGSAGDDYWHITGFLVTNHSAFGYDLDQCDMVVIEDTVGIDNEDGFIRGTQPTRHVVRRAISLGQFNAPLFSLTHGAAIANSQCVGYDLYAYSGRGFYTDYVSGVTIKNMTMGFHNDYALNATNLHSAAVGNAVFLHDSLIHFCTAAGAVAAGASGMVVENMNNFWLNTTPRSNCANAGGVDTAYPYLPMVPMLSGRSRTPMTFFAPSQWEATRAVGGLYPANMDLFGVHNEVAQTRRSWGAMHNYATLRSETQYQGDFTGALYLENAMEQQFVYPVKESWGYVATVWVYLEANYAGNPPEMVVMQPGMVSVVATSTGAIGSWHQLSASITTGADLDWVTVALRSNNTAAGATVGVYYQDLNVN